MQLLLSGRLDHALDVSMRQQLSPHVSLDKLAAVLRRYKEEATLTRLFSKAARGVPRLKKAQVDSVLKQLRERHGICA